LDEINLTINGKSINCSPGTSILNAAADNGFKIPTLCNHSHLRPDGACRLCLVEEEKSGRIFASCVTPVASDMMIRTHTPDILKYRTDIIRLMIANHPESCIVCNKGNRCELRKIAADLGIGYTGLYPMPHYSGLEEANPFIIRDLSKCILCGRCIRADHELVVVGAIDYSHRGFKSRPATLHELSLEKSNCTFCGTCVSLCPTGALMTKNSYYVGSPQSESQTICGFCGIGCSLLMGTVNGKVVDVNPCHSEGTVNLSTLCVRGHFAHDFLNSSKRITTPLVRKDGELSPASWDEALDLVVEKLVSTKNKNGPQSMAFLGSSKCTNEENYLFQKMARVLIGTNNIDNGGYVNGRNILKSLNLRLGGGGIVNPISNLEKADLIFVVGADPIHSAPVLGYYIKRASQKGIPLIVADPRKTGLAPFANIYLQLSPGSDCEMINGLCAMLYEEHAYDMDFINRSTEGFEKYSNSISSFDLKNMKKTTDLDLDLIERAASLMTGKRIAFVLGHGLFQQKNGKDALDALLNLALMTGSLARNNSGFYLLARENNQVGAWDMGSVPDYLPGRQDLQADNIRKQWERNWDIRLTPDPGLDMVQMFEEASKGNLKALYIMGENPVRSLPQSEKIREALNNLDVLVVQDILVTETTEMADIVLPGAAFSEKSGSFTNMEGRVQTFDPATYPPGSAKSDWEILDLLYSKIQQGQMFGTLGKLRKEISKLVPMYSDHKDYEGESWIREISDMELFSNIDGNKIPFSPVHSFKSETVDKKYPLTAILGSLRYHFGSGTRTACSTRVETFAFKGDVEICPKEGRKLKIMEGDSVKISFKNGEITRKVRFDKGLKQGTIFLPTAYNNNEAFNLLDLKRLGLENSPGWKSCEVKIERTG